MESFSQHQFLDVIPRDEAFRRFREALPWRPLGEEEIDLDDALDRVLSRDVVSSVNAPSFDRSNFDGFAVRAADTIGADEASPRTLRLLPQALASGVVASAEVETGTAVAIATGGMLPRGADAIVMVENTDVAWPQLLIYKAVTPGFGVTFAGTDISKGETVLRRGQRLTSRETGVLAAVGACRVFVWRPVRVGIISTGDEIIDPSAAMQPGMVYDSNARIVADAVKEMGAQPQLLGIVRDSLDDLRSVVRRALRSSDVVILSGGTSKGAGDLSYRVVAELDEPGIIAHGVALKPGKPICLAATEGKAVVVLPGFPTSAIFTFHEFVAPLILALGGRQPPEKSIVQATLAHKVNSEIGRTEFLLVGLTSGEKELAAYPMGKGSGSVTTFSRADGFVTIPQDDEIWDAGREVQVQLLGSNLKLPDLVVIGSHCVGLDYLLGKLHDNGWLTKFFAVGSTAGLEAAKRGECDVAGVHLLDPNTGEYNGPFLTPELELISGYGRLQGVVYRRGDARFEGKTAADAIDDVKTDPQCHMINRNQGSGTRILIERLLAGSQPPGYAVQARNHHAVAAAVEQERADWGLAIASVVVDEHLGFLPLAEEKFDFIIPKSRLQKPAVKAFVKLLDNTDVARILRPTSAST